LPAAGRSFWRTAVAAAVLFLALATGAAWSQALPEGWEARIESMREVVGAPETPTPALSAFREELVRLRSTAIELESAAGGVVAELTRRAEALGPPPDAAIVEPPELTERRQALAAELAAAQVPFVEAEEARRSAETLLREIDRVLRARITAELRTRGPSPLVPQYWTMALSDLVEIAKMRRNEVLAAWQDPVRRTALFHRMPLNLALVIIGVMLAFSLRRGLMAWTIEQLRGEASPQRRAWIVVLRNVSRLIVPAVGAGLVFAAFTPEAIFPTGQPAPVFNLPDFVLAIVGAGWLASSLFAPELPEYRLVPLDDPTARRAARTTVGLGLVLAAHLFLNERPAAWSLPLSTTAVLYFPIYLAGGVLLWRTSRLLRTMRRRMDASSSGEANELQGFNRHGPTRVLEQGLWLIGIAVPFVVAAGYFALGKALLFPSILSLGIIGTAVVLFDLVLKTTLSLSRGHAGQGEAVLKEGLLPVAVVGLLILGSLPLLALAWGVPRSDLNSFWLMLRDGVTFGGMRVSASTIVTFAVVFGAVFALTRVLQSVLRSAVLPRTRLDAGGRNAVLAGIGYTGFFLGVLAAISSTGLNLTNVAVVAGALSVGIGFGLQNIVSNFISGIILLVERPIKEGDWIEVGEHMGYVRGISVRSTEIETFDRASVILPNSDLIAGAVLNRTHSGMSGRLTVPVGVSYSSDPRQVERVLVEIAEDHPMVLMDPTPRVLFMGFGADSLNFEIRCWLRDVNFSLSARSDLNFEIYERFKAEGISIPFPQRDIRLKGLREAIRSVTGTADDADGADPDRAAET
jgi:small-conductance mechanosensitive channel